MLFTSMLPQLWNLDHPQISSKTFRMHYMITADALFIYATLLIFANYLGDPMKCDVEYIPQDIINTYCWATGTFTLMDTNKTTLYKGIGPYIPNIDKIREHDYYQWTAFYVFFQGLFFLAPYYFWTLYEGGRLNALTRGFKITNLNFSQNTTEYNNWIKSRCNFLHNYFKTNRNRHQWLYYTFISCEALNLVNDLAQICFMIRMFGNVWDTQNIFENPSEIWDFFPTTTKCIFHMFGSSGELQIYDALCMLPYNLINGPMFYLIFVWICFLICSTVAELIHRVIRFGVKAFRYNMFRKFKLSGEEDMRYLCDNLAVGDLFMLYEVGLNIDTIIFKELVTELKKTLEINDK